MSQPLFLTLLATLSFLAKLPKVIAASAVTLKYSQSALVAICI